MLVKPPKDMTALAVVTQSILATHPLPQSDVVKDPYGRGLVELSPEFRRLEDAVYVCAGRLGARLADLPRRRLVCPLVSFGGAG